MKDCVILFSASEVPNTILVISASGSVGGVQPCQGWGRGFESRLALFLILKIKSLILVVENQSKASFLCIQRRTFLTGAVPNPPSGGKDMPKARVPIVTSNLKEAGYEEDTNSWAKLWFDEQKSHMRLCMRIRRFSLVTVVGYLEINLS